MTSGELRTVDGRYVLDRVLASSPDSEVWLAHDDVVGRPVALKLYRDAAVAAPGWQPAFRARGAALVALSNPGIAETYGYGDSDDDAWLATALVRDAVPLPELPMPDLAGALDIVGQTAMALDASHHAGVAHGAVTADHVLVRPDGAVSLTGFAMSAAASTTEDLVALRTLAVDLIRAPAQAGESVAGVAGFVAELAGAGGRQAPTDAGDLGRTALTLAAALTGTATGVPQVEQAAPPPEDEAESPINDAERTRVRNKLIALGVIVVVFGAALLWIIGRGGSDGTVPDVVDLPVPQAQSDLIQQGFRGDASQPTGTVTAESPPAGTQLKRGSTVTLTVSGGGGS
jgi:hypothetical protein